MHQLCWWWTCHQKLHKPFTIIPFFQFQFTLGSACSSFQFHFINLSKCTDLPYCIWPNPSRRELFHDFKYKPIIPAEPTLTTGKSKSSENSLSLWVSENLQTCIEHSWGFSLVVRCTLRERKVPSSILGIPSPKTLFAVHGSANSEEIWMALNGQKMRFWFWFWTTHIVP